MPTRIEVNVQTGEKRVLELTPEEVADANARTAAEARRPRQQSELEKLVAWATTMGYKP